MGHLEDDDGRFSAASTEPILQTLDGEDSLAGARDTAAHIAHLPTLPPDEREAYWLKWVYQGNEMPQLTSRAIIMGAFLGGIMALSNLYVGLRIGWAFGVAITACILSFSICKVLGIKMSLLENNCMSSTASSAGYSTGGTMVSGVAAYLMIEHHHMTPLVLTLWTLFLAALGVFVAIPMKRQMIDVEQLRFPSGIAAAETLRSLHAAGGEASQKAKALGLAGAFAAAWKLLQLMDPRALFDPRPLLELIKGNNVAANPSYDLSHKLIPDTWAPDIQMSGYKLSEWTVQFELSWLLMAAGAIMGWKSAWSMLLGACINYLYLAPHMVQIGDIQPGEHLTFRDIAGWSTWTGVSIMVTSSLLMFAMQWRTVLRAFQGIMAVFGAGSKESNDALEAVEVPPSWFLTGSFLSGAGCVAVLVFAFNTKFQWAVLAVLLSFVLCMVACRVTGETDFTPMGAMGKVAQLTFGYLAPSNMITNLMTASVTAGAASSSADLLTDLKSGYLLGASPRQQFLAQFAGIFTGTLVVVPAFYLLIPTYQDIGGEKFPCPAGQVWMKVAEVLKNGFESLPQSAQTGLLVGAVLGLILPLIEMKAPKALKPFIPSATGLGLAFVIPFSNSLSFFIGALAAAIYTRFFKTSADKMIVPVSSGLIAGESLMGIVGALLVATHFIDG